MALNGYVDQNLYSFLYMVKLNVSAKTHLEMTIMVCGCVCVFFFFKKMFSEAFTIDYVRPQ